MAKLFNVGLFILLLLVSSLFLSSIPGLMGDEASEGQNVYEILNGESFLTVKGERSYIGPLIDYIRIPFVLTFGYTTLALRLPILLFGLATFLLAIPTFKRLFGEEAVPLALAFFFFNPIYLTYQRLGWAITLLPFFFILTLFFLTSKYRYKWLWTGLVAGLGLHTHVLFLPTLVGIVVGVFGYWGLGIFSEFGIGYWDLVSKNSWSSLRRKFTSLAGAFMLIIIGFSAAFGSQFVVMQLWTEDQGDVEAQVAVSGGRFGELPELVPLAVSGAPFVARYTGQLWSVVVVNAIAIALVLLIVLGALFGKRRKVILAIVAGAFVNLITMIYLVPQYSPRYLVMFGLAIWLAAGVSLAELLLLIKPFPHGRWKWGAVGVALAGCAVFVALVVIPFKQTGGSTAEFELVNFSENAESLVSEGELIECVRGVGTVSSGNPHIYNRILYASYTFSDIEVLPEEKMGGADWIVHYREEGDDILEEEACPGLRHFMLLPK